MGLERIATWETHHPELAIIGDRLERFNGEVARIANSLGSMGEFGSTNPLRTRNLVKELVATRQFSSTIETRNAFDSLVLAELQHSLDAQLDWISFHCYPDSYRKNTPRRTVGTFIGTQFAITDPRLTEAFRIYKEPSPIASNPDLKSSWRYNRTDKKHKPKASPINYFEAALAQFPYEKLSRYNEVLTPFWNAEIELTDPFMQALAMEGFRRETGFVLDFVKSLDWLPRGYVSQALRERLNRDALTRKLSSIIASGERRPLRRLATTDRANLDKALRRPSRLGDFVQVSGEFSTVDLSTRMLTLRPDLVLFYNSDSEGAPVDANARWTGYGTHDPSGYDPRSLKGESFRTFAHELTHIVQALAHPTMPSGIRHVGNAYNLYQSTMVEGTAVTAELLAIDYLRHNRKHLGLLPEDVTAARIGDLERDLAKLKRLLFTIFAQEFFYDNSSKQAASKRLALLSSNEADWDEDKFGTETLVNTEYFGTYIRGEHVAKSIIKRVPQEIHALYRGKISSEQSEQMARALTGDVVFGMTLGAFGPRTMDTFILKHYLPRLVREYEGTRFPLPEPK